jgi:hypothetical protein
MVHVLAPTIPLPLRFSFAGAALLVLLPGCPTDPVPVDDTGTSTSVGSSSTGTPQPDPDSTTVDDSCGTGGCSPGDTSSTGSPGGSSSEGSSGGSTSGSSSGDPGTSSSSEGDSGSSGGTTDGLSAGTSSSSDGGFETGFVFILDPDTPLSFECDPFAQDCPVGEKCNAWANDGGSSWNATACFPIDPAPVGVGETCVVQGSGVSGIDNCELGAMCWDVDTMTNEGTCVPLCTGTEAAPVCDPGLTCAISNDGALNLCLPGCDPLLQDCIPGQACYPIGPGFTCAPDSSGAQGVDDDGCEFINVCDPGLMCAEASLLDNCAAFFGCCTPFCDFSVGGDPCPSALEECVPYFDVGLAPPGFEDVGICAIP